MKKLYYWFTTKILFISWGKYWKGAYIHCLHPKYCLRIFLWGVDAHRKPSDWFLK